MKLIKWDSLFDVTNLFDDMPSLGDIGWDLATDVSQKDGNVIVDIQMPGIEADAYNIKLEGGMLIVSGKRDNESEEQDQDFYRKEIRRGSFERRIALPEGEWDMSQMTTSKDNGTLKLVVPGKSE